MLPVAQEASHYGPRLSSLIALLEAAFPLRISKSQSLDRPTMAVHWALQQQPVAHIDETVAYTGNAHGGNPKGMRVWLWVALSPVVTVLLQGLSHSAASTMELLGCYCFAFRRQCRAWSRTAVSGAAATAV